jgi:hypothetical protein
MVAADAHSLLLIVLTPSLEFLKAVITSAREEQQPLAL